MEQDFAESWRMIVGAEAEFPVEEEHRRKGAGDEQEIVEPGVEEFGGGMRFDEPAVEGVEEAADGEKTVGQVAERWHDSRRRFTGA